MAGVIAIRKGVLAFIMMLIRKTEFMYHRTWLKFQECKWHMLKGKSIRENFVTFLVTDFYMLL